MPRSLNQRIADKEAELNRLREQSRKRENGQKIILGGMLLSAARNDDRIRQWVLKEADRSVTRKTDKERLAPLLDELASMDGQQREDGHHAAD